MPRLLLKAEMQKLAQLQDADSEGRKQAHIDTILSMVKRAARARAWSDMMQGGMAKEALVAAKATGAAVKMVARRGARAAAAAAPALGPRPQLPARPKLFQRGVISSAQTPATSGTIVSPGNLKAPSYIERVWGGPQPTTLPSHAPSAVNPPRAPATRPSSYLQPPPIPRPMPRVVEQAAASLREPVQIELKGAPTKVPKMTKGELAQAREAGLRRPKAHSFQREMTPAQREEYITGRRETRLMGARRKLQELETKLRKNPAEMTRQEHRRLAKLRANPELMDYHRAMQSQEARAEAGKNLKWGLAAGIGLPVAALGYGAYKTVGALAPALSSAAANPMAPGGGWSPVDYGYGSNPYGPGALNLGPGA